LILGGTSEGAALARRLDGDRRFDVISSIAGATRNPAALPGRLARGGFGGADGLAAYLKAERIERVVDATHPFSLRISTNAEQACRQAGVPLLQLVRAPWRREPGDRWIEVEDAAAAAQVLPAHGRRAFLTLGRRELSAFTDLPGVWILARVIDRRDIPPAAPFEFMVGRGPFRREAETALLSKHAIDVVVSRNSGGHATYAKIEAARRLGIAVVMLRRPAKPEAAAVDSVEAALAWLREERDGG
jgi:precorrin-6A/cobalt-precorrin-6A reductase